jgi:hypothetical protein
MKPMPTTSTAAPSLARRYTLRHADEHVEPSWWRHVAQVPPLELRGSPCPLRHRECLPRLEAQLLAAPHAMGRTGQGYATGPAQPSAIAYNLRCSLILLSNPAASTKRSIRYRC